MRRLGKYLTITGLLMLALGFAGLFSPWTYDIYIWLFPEEQTAYASEIKGGPYPELMFLPMIVIGVFVGLYGFLLFANPKNSESKK